MEDLPAEAEVSRVMREFKQALKAAPYQTPLCRAQRQLRSRLSVQHAQHSQSQAQKVQHLLPSGHRTILNPDVLRAIATSDCRPHLLIPPTLLSTASGAVLLTNKPNNDLVDIYKFSELTTALQALEKADKVPPRPDFPRLVYRSEAQPSSFHYHFESAKSAWRRSSISQHLQVFIQPRSRAPSLLRVHWKQKQPLTCYALYEEHRPAPLPPLIKRSVSVVAKVQPESAFLTVVRIKRAPSLEPVMVTIARILRPLLEKEANVCELVCDFTQDPADRWVFLRCQGLVFQQAREQLGVAVIAPKCMGDPSFRVFPVVVRTKAEEIRLCWSDKLHAIAAKHHLSWSNFLSSTKEFSQLPADSKAETLQPLREKMPKRCSLAEEVMSKGVEGIDRLLCMSRASRAQAAKSQNFVEMYGGEDLWRPAILAALQDFYQRDEIIDFVLDGMSHEQILLVSNSLFRILRGDYNFYYKETLRKVHFRYDITPKHYQTFLLVIEEVATPMCVPEHTQAIMRRFREFQQYICHC